MSDQTERWVERKGRLGLLLSRLSRSVRGLRAQMLLWTILPLTLVLIGVAFTGAYSHDRSMRELVAERDGALAALVASQIGHDIDRREAQLTTLAGAEAFHRGDVGGIQTALAEGYAATDFPLGIVLLDDTATVRIGIGHILTDAPPDPGQLHAIVESVMSSQRPAGALFTDAASGEDVLLLGVPAPHAPTAPGVLLGATPLADLGLAARLADAGRGDGTAIYLLDANGRVLASRGSPTHTETMALPDLSDDDIVASRAPIAGGQLQWSVVIVAPWHEVIEPVLRFSQIMPLVAILATIVSLLTLYYGYRSIVRPLQSLGRRAEQVAWGNFAATREPVGGVREIEDLQATLDDMAGRIQSYQAGMHDYIAALTQGQEEERKRIARELHDGTTQTLIALRQQMELAQRDLPARPERASERIAQVRHMLVETLDEVRRFSRDLRPLYLDDLGFVPAIEMLVRERDQLSGTSIQISTTGQARRLPADIELTAYRIVQEALNNVTQHSGAANARAEIAFEDTHLTLRIADDGQGFVVPESPATWAHHGHFGLMGIHERVLLHGGQIAVQSTPGAGVRITVRLPYPTSS